MFEHDVSTVFVIKTPNLVICCLIIENSWKIIVPRPSVEYTIYKSSSQMDKEIRTKTFSSIPKIYCFYCITCINKISQILINSSQLLYFTYLDHNQSTGESSLLLRLLAPPINKGRRLGSLHACTLFRSSNAASTLPFETTKPK